MSIRLVSWNVNGLRAVSAKPEWRWFAENTCDVIGLQETKAMPEQLKPEVANPEGWEAHWASSVVKKGYSGVAVFSRIKPLAVRCELPQPEWQGEGRILHLEFEKFHFFNGYFPNGGAEELDENGKPIPGTEMEFDVDTILLSVGLIPENELTKQAGIEMDPRTKGAIVYENMETSLPGVFACGNVLHVHDLVDFVSQEAAKAGENAAHYILSGQGETATVRLEGKNGVRYTVPQQLDPHHMADSVTVRFRVGRPYQKAALCVYTDGKLLRRVPKRILTPGEMEQFPLRREELPEGVRTVTFQIEEGEAK